MRRDCEKKVVYEEVRYYDTWSHTCTLTKSRCCAPLPQDSLRLDGVHDCRKCNVPLLFAFKGVRDDLMKAYHDIMKRMEEKE